MAGNTEERTKLVADRVPATGADPSSGSGTRTILTTMPEVREASLKVAKSAQRLLSIFTQDLEPLIYGEEPFLEAIKRLGAGIRQASMDECWTAVIERKHPAFKGVFVHPFDDDDFIAGNATAGLEILEDLPDVTSIVAGFGGGGLSCGIASAMAAKEWQPTSTRSAKPTSTIS